MRFFIALDIPQESKDQIKKVQVSIKELIPEARITDNDKLHITLAFIGDQPEDLQQKLEQAMNQAVADLSPFTLTPSYLDGFPTIHHPNILWVGVKGDVDKLLIINERVRDGLRALQIQVDQRRFIPHIAIAKLSNYHTPQSIEQQLQSMIFGDFDPITISSIKLFESIPDLGFHSHNTLAQIQLV